MYIRYGMCCNAQFFNFHRPPKFTYKVEWTEIYVLGNNYEQLHAVNIWIYYQITVKNSYELYMSIRINVTLHSSTLSSYKKLLKNRLANPFFFVINWSLYRMTQRKSYTLIYDAPGNFFRKRWTCNLYKVGK